MKNWKILFLLLCFVSAFAKDKTFDLQNAKGDLKVQLVLSETGQLTYSVKHSGKTVLENSPLGLVRTDGDFSTGLRVRSFSKPEKLSENYEMFQGKRKQISYSANQYVLALENASGGKINVVFRLSHDGVAFRYQFPENTSDIKYISSEKTGFKLPASARAWLQPMSKAKTGWEQTNPSYEEHYSLNVAPSAASEIGEGWIFPALFQSNGSWVLISEADLDAHYCASRLVYDAKTTALQVTFPQPEEVFTNGALTPQGKLPLQSPWRLIAIGSLKTLVESTLGTDLAAPSEQKNTSYIKGGAASWSWILGKDESITYDISKSYIDHAAKMKWPFCLIDVNWDTRIGTEKMKELVAYGKSKNVKLLLWYNSAGAWNTTPYTPKHELLTAEGREKTFKMLHDMGIAGVKIDFFGGDGQSMIAYYHDMLTAAAKYELLVNFHGATLPRGWQRTYPNLMTAEAVKGEEFVTFFQEIADLQPSHCAMLPFARNVFDPMDFTPTILDQIPGTVKRRTTQGFELALPTLFLSGIQHIAEGPEGMAKMPDYVVNYLQDIPVNWDDSKFLDGFPGKFVVIARQKDGVWFVSGINGENSVKEVTLDLSFTKNGKGILITDGDGKLIQHEVSQSKNIKVTMQPYGGFVIKM